LKDDGTLSFITPSSWISSTNSVYELLKNKIFYVNLSNDVSNSFGSTGGSQKFVYFLANKTNSKKCITKFDNNIEIEFNPTDTPIAPIKSSSYYIFEFVEKLYNSNFSKFEWQRFDSFMISCIQAYLANGIMKCNYINFKQRTSYIIKIKSLPITLIKEI
jgi:hypothetical protein